MAEASIPWPPTSPPLRVAAVRAYCEGERLCDEGKMNEGLAALKRAFEISWELESTEWPGWAEVLYGQIQSGQLALGPADPPLLAKVSDSAEASLSVFGDVAVCHVWQNTPAVIEAIRASLNSRHFAIVDNFAPESASSCLHTALTSAWERGLLQPAKVAAPGNGLEGTRSARTRSDFIAWIDVNGCTHAGAGAEDANDAVAATSTNDADASSAAATGGAAATAATAVTTAAAADLVATSAAATSAAVTNTEPSDVDKKVVAASNDAEWTSLRQVVDLVDRLVRQLRAAGTDAVDSITSRMRPMVSRYGEGSAFARHCDNHCDAGSGPLCNGRVLTAVYYCNNAWRRGDGGCLRLYKPQGSAAAAAAEALAVTSAISATGALNGDAEALHRGAKARSVQVAPCLTTPHTGSEISRSSCMQYGAGEAFQKSEPACKEATRGLASSGDALCDVAPLSNRLMLFLSDFRCPHEVLPLARGERYAATLWYMDSTRRSGSVLFTQ